jgi:hypothetical protein
MHNVTRSARFALLCIALPASGAVGAAEDYTLTLKDHRFTPAEIEVPAGQKFKLVVKNEDASPEEFESKTLKREKIIPPNGRIVMPLGPLEPGTYEFFGEFHEKTAQGRLIAK